MPSVARLRLLRPVSALPLLFASFTASVFATTPLALEVPDSASTAPAAAASTPAPARRTVLLLGDQPTVLPTGGKRQPVELETTAGLLLDARITDRTAPGTTVEQVQKQSREILALKPDAVLLFAGPADEAAKTSDDAQVYSLQSFGRAVSAAGVPLFVLPASTDLGAASTAILRIGATGAGDRVTFVELGGELGGRPFEEALEQIRTTLDSPVAAPEPTPAPTPQIELPATEATPAPEAAPGKTAVQDQKETGLPPALTGTPRPDQKPAQISEEDDEATSGRTRATGPQATPATLKMRAPAPLKQFSPRRPAPNKPTEKKQPSFDR